MLHNLLMSLVKKYKIDATLYIPYKSFRYLSRKKIIRQLIYRVKTLPPLLNKMCFISPILADCLAKIFISKEQQVNRYEIWHSTFAYPAGYIASFTKDVPTVLRCPGVDVQMDDALNYGMRKDSLINSRVVSVLRKVDILIATSQSVREEYIKVITKDNKIRIIPNGIGILKFNLDKDKLTLRKKLGIPLNKKVIITIGRNHPKKNYKYIFEITKSLLDLRDDFIWLVIGKATEKLFMHDRYNLLNRYIFLKGQIGLEKVFNNLQAIENLPPTELIEYYNAADIFVFPSLLESFGIVLIEAMAARLPVVTFDVPGSRDIIKNGYNGLCVSPEDAKAMAEAINKIIEDVDFREKLVRNALKDVKENYDWDVVAKRYIMIYENLLKNRNLSICN